MMPIWGEIKEQAGRFPWWCKLQRDKWNPALSLVLSWHLITLFKAIEAFSSLRTPTSRLYLQWILFAFKSLHYQFLIIHVVHDQGRRSGRSRKTQRKKEMSQIIQVPGDNYCQQCISEEKIESAVKASYGSSLCSNSVDSAHLSQVLGIIATGCLLVVTQIIASVSHIY